MKIGQIQTLSGPNLWSRAPVLLTEFSCEAAQPDHEALARLHGWLTANKSTIEPFDGGIALQLLLVSIAIELQRLAGAQVPDLHVDQPTAEVATFRAAIPYDEELVGREAAALTVRMIDAAIANDPIDVTIELRALRDLADQRCLGPSTRAIVEAAIERGIPVQRLNRGSFVQLGHGALQRRIRTAETDQSSAVAESICEDKDLTKRLLAAVGVPVPEGRLVSDRDDAWEAAQEIELPVVVKPRDGNHGRGVFTDLKTKEQVQRAYDAAVLEGSGVIVEQFAPGCEHRVLVVGDKMVAATGGEPAYITGDGTNTIEQLIERQLNSDPRRGDDYDTPLSPIELDDPVTLLVLEQQGFSVQSIPPAGASVLVQRNGNLAIDVTDRVHPEVAARAVDAARVVGLDVAGIDIVVEDIGQPLESQRGMIVEVNAGPGLQMHLSPMEGTPRPVGEAIVDSLFPPTQQGRIPIAAVCGGAASAEISTALERLLQSTFNSVGRASNEQITVNRRQLSGVASPAALLMNPLVEAAIFEVTSAGVGRSGLPFDRCRAVIMQGEIEASLVRILADCAGSDGWLVTASGRSLSDVLPAERLLLVGAKIDEHLDRHVRFGGSGCAVVDGVAYLIVAGQRHSIFDVPVGGKNAALRSQLLAIAGAWALGVPIEKLQTVVTALDD
jgi:cyanophycin synthetase